jgi:hypothetical protein
VTLHYHGTPITPGTVLGQLTGRCFCVSYARPDNVERCHQIGQSVMLDNGAFSIWQRVRDGKPLPARLEGASGGDWGGFYDWAEPWLDYPTTWAVIPDVIDGDEDANDRLLVDWFTRRLPKGAPVWHMHESIERLRRLCHGYARVCIGSSGAFATVGDDRWHRRMEEAMNAICASGSVPTWLHMLRGMSLSGHHYPFASVDSTDVAVNHNRPWNDPVRMATRWDGLNCKPAWVPVHQQELVLAGYHLEREKG